MVAPCRYRGREGVFDVLKQAAKLTLTLVKRQVESERDATP